LTFVLCCAFVGVSNAGQRVGYRDAEVVCRETSRVDIEAYELGAHLGTFIVLHYSSSLEKQEEVKNTNNLGAGTRENLRQRRTSKITNIR
jgi:hypothetical protein